MPVPATRPATSQAPKLSAGRCWRGEPGSWAALQILGMAAQQQNDAVSAEAFFAQALASAPARADLLRDRATALLNLSRLAEAVTLFEQSLAIDPRDLVTLNSLGIAQLQRRDFDAAIRAFERALVIDPDLVAAVNNLGNVYRELGQLDLAADWYRRAVTLAPTRSSAINNLAVTLRDQGHLGEAIAGYRQAIALDPANTAARSNLATALSQIGERDGAIAEYREAFRRDPRSDQAASGLMQELSHFADWPDDRRACADRRGYEPNAHWPPACARRSSRCTTSPAAMIRPITLRSRKATARQPPGAWNGSGRCCAARRVLATAQTTVAFASAISPRISGIIPSPISRRGCSPPMTARPSPFTSMPMAARMRACIAGASRAMPKSSSISTSWRRLPRPNASPMTASISWSSCRAIPAARASISQPCGPRPLQLHWLGYPGSIGADFLDYLIADRKVVPDEHLGFYAEKILRLPNSYQINSGAQVIAEGMTRGACGLPEEAMVLCCFNQIAKLDPVIFGLWMRLLGEFPDCVLWLLAGEPRAATNLRRFAAEQGVAPERLIFAPKLDKTRHLGRLGLADLALDTRIYNGHTTTGDALLAGLPVVTMAGRHFASRVSASLLTTQGLEELDCARSGRLSSPGARADHGPATAPACGRRRQQPEQRGRSSIRAALPAIWRQPIRRSGRATKRD